MHNAVILFLLIGTLLTMSGGAHSQTLKKPNIIYILADDLGIGDIGPYGQKTLQTPHLDQLARDGMKFERHYAGATVCAPSRCVLMTGLHTGHSAIRGNGPGNIPDEALTVPKLLKQQGYYTGAIGKYGLGKPLRLDEPRYKGFDYFFGYVGTSHAHNFYPETLIRNGQPVSLANVTIPETERDNQDYTDPKIKTMGVAHQDHRKDWAPQWFSDDISKFIEERATQTQPFYLYYALNIPHTNNEAKADSPLGHGMESPNYGQYQDRDWPDSEKGFAQFITFLDLEIGKIVQLLDKLGISENTIVMFSSDNGAHREGGHDPNFFKSSGIYRGIKRDHYDGGIRVPLLVKWKSKIQPGSSNSHVSGFQDLLPTLGEIIGAPANYTTDGISFLPTLLGRTENQNAHAYLFWNFDEQGGKQAVLKWPWKLIHLNTGMVKRRNHEPLPWDQRKVELYQLEKDPQERQNVASDHPELLAELEIYMKASYQAPLR